MYGKSLNLCTPRGFNPSRRSTVSALHGVSDAASLARAVALLGLPEIAATGTKALQGCAAEVPDPLAAAARTGSDALGLPSASTTRRVMDNNVAEQHQPEIFEQAFLTRLSNG
jgi:hypothetical protein